MPSLVIGMYGVVMLTQMTKCTASGALATVWCRPQPNRSMSRRSRAILMLPDIGVRLTHIVNVGFTALNRRGPDLDGVGNLRHRITGAQGAVPCSIA